MSTPETIARVILRADANVHIAFPGVRSIHATAANLQELFIDPIEFIETTSESYPSSAYTINRNRENLMNIRGLTLATVNSDKQITINFPELFTFIFEKLPDEQAKHEKLNMREIKYLTSVADEKAYLLRYYLDFTDNLQPGLEIKKNLKLREEVQYEIIREAINVFFGEELPKPSKTKKLSDQISFFESTEVLQKETSGEGMIGASDYAAKYGISVGTVYRYVNMGLLKNVYRDPKRNKLYVDENEVPENWDRRRGRKRAKKDGEKAYKIKSSASAKEIETHILKKKIFSAAIAEYIQTATELKYFTDPTHRYYEMKINGQPVLVRDVNPDYISTITNKSNRELMQQGLAPVVPERNKEQYKFHIHHLAQREGAWAIIPEYDHNSKNLSAVFHQGKPNKELHGPEFEVQKKSFWRRLLSLYDEFGSFPFYEAEERVKKER